MKLGCLFLLAFMAFVTAFGLLIGLRGLRPGPEAPPTVVPRGPRPSPMTTPPPMPTPPPDVAPDTYKEWVDALHEFKRWEWGGRYSVGYGFIDYQGRTQQISCQIAKDEYEREKAGFGYSEAELDRVVDVKLREYLERELEARDLDAYVRVKVEKGRASAESEIPAMNREEQNRISARIKTFYTWWDGAVPKQREAIEKPLYKQRGFLLERNNVSPDYAGLALASGPRLADCFRALKESGRGYNTRQYLGLFIAFFQEIRYELPPDVIDGRETLGVWVPTEVLVNDHGDCDSKAVAFASMFRNFGTPVMLIELREHVLIGAEVRPRPGEKYVLVNNHYYVIGEVAGPGKRRPGDASGEVWTEISGHFKYTLVPPPGDSGSAGTRGSS